MKNIINFISKLLNNKIEANNSNINSIDSEYYLNKNQTHPIAYTAHTIDDAKNRYEHLVNFRQNLF